MEMLKNNIKMTFRNMLQHKMFSFINIAGLAAGFMVFIFILLYVERESSYDDYHQNGDRLFRVAVNFRSESSQNGYAFNVPPLAPALIQNFPQVKYAARVMNFGNNVLTRYGNKKFYETQLLYTDPDIFRIFTIPFIFGNPDHALNRPQTVVISETMRQKYFDDINPVGKTIQLDGREYEVTGVVGNCPDNTHLKYNMFTSIHAYDHMPWMGDWTWPGAYTFIMLNPNVDIRNLEQQINTLAEQRTKGNPRSGDMSYTHFLQPVRDIHLYSHLKYEFSYGGNRGQLYIFIAIGILVLVIAALNYINLSTARTIVRAKEVVIRKVTGASRIQLVIQFLGESLTITLSALVLAYFLVRFVLPYYNYFISGHFTAMDLLKPGLVVPVVLVSTLTGLIAGSYPAFILSGFKPVSVLSGQIKSGPGGVKIRRVIVIGQFFITVILIIGTFIILWQLSYMKGIYPGFSREHKLVIPVQGLHPLEQNFETIKSEILKQPGVIGASVSSGVPGGGFGSATAWLDGKEKQMVYYMFCDSDFLTNYNINLTAGRDFRKDNIWDKEHSCIINESAVRAFGFRSPQDAIGEKVNESFFHSQVEIIGVTKDFNYLGMQFGIDPLVIQMRPQFFSHITANLDTGNLQDVLVSMEKKWTDMFPEKPFEYYFLDESMNRLYHSEERTARIIGIFTLFALFAVCLGLLGMTLFFTGRRTKEIGVRKVLGSSKTGIIGLLTAEIVKLVFIANVLAWPAAWYVMHKWLQNFAYRIDLSVWPFVLSGMAVLAVTLLTVSWQVLRTAGANPVEALRYE